MKKGGKLEVTPQVFKWYKELPFNDWVRFLNNHCKEHNFLRRILKMGLLDMDGMGVNDAVEPVAVPGDREYKLRIIGVNHGDYQDKQGNKHDYLQPRIEIVEEPSAKEFTHFLTIPDGSMDAKQLNRARWSFKSFCQAFDLPLDGEVNPDDQWPGSEGYAILGLKEDEQYGEQNFIKKMVMPK